jgi:hypothetical protein
MDSLRKLIAIALLALFGLPFASTLLALAPKSEANLPACCRRSGKHHCMMAMAERTKLVGDKPEFGAPPEKCPFAPSHAITVPAHDLLGVLSGSAIFAGLVSHPAVYPQTLAQWRINRDRSNQKRGPPTA